MEICWTRISSSGLAILSMAMFLTGAESQCDPSVGELTYLDSGTRRDLKAVAWSPGDAYALLAGQGIYAFDGEAFTTLASEIQGNAVAWKPDGSQALIVGNGGSIVRFDGKVFEPVESRVTDQLTGVDWAPDGSYALIVGYGGTILKYSEKRMENLSVASGAMIEGVAFRPDGSKALMVALVDYANLALFSYDGTGVKKVWEDAAITPGDVAWDIYGDEALVPCDWGHVMKYNGEVLVDLETGIEQQTDGLDAIDFNPMTNAALIVGAWYHNGFTPRHTVLLYEDGVFTTLLNVEKESALRGVAWRRDGQSALIVGDMGVVVKYVPEGDYRLAPQR